MPQSNYPDLTSFKALSFDCYGTLVDWNSGFLALIEALISQLPGDHPLNESPPTRALKKFSRINADLQTKHPNALPNELLVSAASKLAHELGITALSDSIAEPFGNAPGTFAAFPDTVAGLQKLKKYYKLAILSNIDNANMKSTVEQRLEGADFDAVYTAQDVGNFKPNRKTFEYLFGHARQDLDVDSEKGELLHVAHSLYFDHVPSKELGLRSVWISRGDDDELSEFEGTVAFEWKFDTIGKFADEVERQFNAKGQ